MIKIGMIIGDRYEILEKIGTGGMSDVYKAKCHKLNRLVAVKVLKQEFSENANFVSKFRIEAQAAAGLMHPNIVNVYDVGEENGIHYIVMELVEGITLKRYIEKKARLSYKEAGSIAIQVKTLAVQAASMWACAGLHKQVIHMSGSWMMTHCLSRMPLKNCWKQIVCWTAIMASCHRLSCGRMAANVK